MSNAFAFLSNSLWYHVTLALLVMVGPGKLMVGHSSAMSLPIKVINLVATLQYELAQ